MIFSQFIGDKIPWNVSLKNFSVYTLHHQSNAPLKALQLLKPTTVNSTVGVSYKYNPPTSDDISSLGLCLHTDMHNVTGSVSYEQVGILQDCQVTEKELVPVSLNILSLRFSKVPYSLYGTFENLKLKMFSETGTVCMELEKILGLRCLVKQAPWQCCSE